MLSGMSSRTDFEFVVVGSDLAGLLVANLLQRQDRRVLLITQKKDTLSYCHQGIQIPTRPAWLPDTGQTRDLDSLLHVFGVEPPEASPPSSREPPLQIITPDQRLDLSLDPWQLGRELARAMPEQRKSVLEAIRGFQEEEGHYEGWLRSAVTSAPMRLRGLRVYRKLFRPARLASLPNPLRGPPLLRILAAATAFQSNLHPTQLSAITLGHLILRQLEPSRCWPQLDETLRSRFCQSGGTLDTQSQVEKILMDRRQVIGVQNLPGKRTTDCQALISCLTAQEMLGLVPPERQYRGIRVAARAFWPSHSLFLVHVIAPREAIPMGMANHVLMVRALGLPLEEDNLIRLQVLPCPGRPGMVVIGIGCLVPQRKIALGREYLGPLQTRILDAGKWLIPFLTENWICHSSPYWQSRAGDRSFESPWEIHPVWATNKTAVFGRGILPLTTSYRNLFHCGPESFPGLGLEGAALAAINTVRMIQHRETLN